MEQAVVRRARRADLTKIGDLAELQTFKAELEELRQRRKERSNGSEAPEQKWTSYDAPWLPKRTEICPECQYPVEEGRSGKIKTGRRVYLEDLGMMGDEEMPCPSCSGAVARRERFERYRSLMAEARLPRYSEQWTFETFPMHGKESALHDVTTFARGKVRSTFTNLYISGPFGVGKTGLAVCVARARLEQEQPVLFWTLPDLLTRIKATYDASRAESEDELIERLGSVDLLVLDDVGTEKPSEWQREKLYQILNRRMNDDLETVFTSNMTPFQLEAHVGERIVERIEFHCLPVELAGVNLRRQ
jgi:DNA replication protein DnaC